MKHIFNGLLFFTLFAPYCLGSTTIEEQAVIKAVHENRKRVAGGYCPYEASDFTDTPAPEGYKPFYINHYGRHGSRYQDNLVCYESVLPLLDSLHSVGLLTPEAVVFKDELTLLYKRSENMEGMLSQIGCEEHRQIASRLALRYPRIFTGKDARIVSCISSEAARCVMSMANFVSALKTIHPQLEVNMDAGNKYRKIIAPRIRCKRAVIEGKEYADSLLNSDEALINSLSSRLLRNPGACPDAHFMFNLFQAAVTSCCIEDMPDMLRHFTDDELLFFYKVSNLKRTCRDGNVTGDGHLADENAERLRKAGGIIGGYIVGQVDKALEGNGHCADFKFGHDTGVVPLLSFLEPEGFAPVRIKDAWYKWPTWRTSPMGVNVQLIFFRNDKKSDILVKLLVNEKETLIPALKAVDGPYYRWADLRKLVFQKSGN